MTIIRMLKQSLFRKQPDVVLPAALESVNLREELVAPIGGAPFDKTSISQDEKKVLNVGGNSKEIPIPKHYDNWTHHILDMDPSCNPDVICDARKLVELPGNAYDSVYCAHNLEHYYSHEVIKVLKGFNHVLKNDGFVNIAVPDMQAVIKHMVQNDMDIEDVLYESLDGAVTIKDVIYGFGKEIEKGGQDFYAHKTGFSERSLIALLNQCGFMKVYCLLGYFEIRVIGFRQQPSQDLLTILNLPLLEDDQVVEK